VGGDSEPEPAKDPSGKRMGLSAVPPASTVSRKRNGQMAAEKMSGELAVTAGERRATPVLLAPRNRDNN
jgi:hypothetical protein